MNKAELLAYLLAKPQIISLADPVEKEEIYGYKKYIVNAVVTTDTDAMTMQNIGFYENIATSECLFMNSEPFIEQDPGFVSKVADKVKTLIDAGTIKAAFQGDLCSHNNQMLVKVIANDNTEKTFLCQFDNAGKVIYEQI